MHASLHTSAAMQTGCMLSAAVDHLNATAYRALAMAIELLYAATTASIPAVDSSWCLWRRRVHCLSKLKPTVHST